MGKQVSKSLAIAYVTGLESVRRKDPYVVLILAGVIVLGAGLMAQFGVEGLHKFVKDVGLTVTTLFSIVICVTTAARQLPTEIENRTLYPLLGKPLSRTAFYLGKYLGVGILSSMVVVLFFLVVRVLLAILGIPVGTVFYQALYLRVLSMWFIAAGVLCLSLYLTQGANVTISLLACLCMQLFAHSILYLHDTLTGIRLRLAETVYWLAPHLELFDLSKKVIHDWPPVPGWVIAVMTLYAILYTGLLLGIGCLRMRRMTL
ncbi:MAG: ABC transporter permease [Candidatus Hydrogenedentes bacterium]|nr:ABC transporter permease [Candidatus Hydrogenedentota bacterium]